MGAGTTAASVGTIGVGSAAALRGVAARSASGRLSRRCSFLSTRSSPSYTDSAVSTSATASALTARRETTASLSSGASGEEGSAGADCAGAATPRATSTLTTAASVPARASVPAIALAARGSARASGTAAEGSSPPPSSFATGIARGKAGTALAVVSAGRTAPMARSSRAADAACVFTIGTTGCSPCCGAAATRATVRSVWATRADSGGAVGGDARSSGRAGVTLAAASSGSGDDCASGEALSTAICQRWAFSSSMGMAIRSSRSAARGTSAGGRATRGAASDSGWRVATHRASR